MRRENVSTDLVTEIDFGLDELPEIEQDKPAAAAPDPDHNLEDWAAAQLSKGTGGAVFDIETGGLADEELRKLYTEPTFEDFAANCDSRWKPETVAAKFEDSKAGAWAKFVDRAALSPLTGRVVA